MGQFAIMDLETAEVLSGPFGKLDGVRFKLGGARTIDSPKPGSKVTFNDREAVFVNYALTNAAAPSRFHVEAEREFSYEKSTFTLTESIVWEQGASPQQADVQEEAYRRIVRELPEYKQRNALMDAVFILFNAVDRAVENAFTDEERADIEKLLALRSNVLAVRQASNEIEQTDGGIPVSYQEDERWP